MAIRYLLTSLLTVVFLLLGCSSLQKEQLAQLTCGANGTSYDSDGVVASTNGIILDEQMNHPHTLIDYQITSLKKRKKMKPTKARIKPLQESEWTSAQRVLLDSVKGKQPFYNVSATFARHAVLAEKFKIWAYHVMGDSSTLDGRYREILILRVGWLCNSEYEWGQHVIFAKKEGLSDQEIERIKLGSSAEGWSDIERALIKAADELHSDSFIGDVTWNTLAKEFSEQQMMDIVFAVGQYHMVSMALNSFGVQLDDGIKGF